MDGWREDEWRELSAPSASSYLPFVMILCDVVEHHCTDVFNLSETNDLELLSAYRAYEAFTSYGSDHNHGQVKQKNLHGSLWVVIPR